MINCFERLVHTVLVWPPLLLQRTVQMPWEKTFNESDVIEQVMQVFWKKGYSATSISDLTEATGIKRGSLYNAFQSKDGLFIKSLLKYENEQRRAWMTQAEEQEDAKAAILDFFDDGVKSSLNDPERKGCLLINTAVDFSIHNEEVKKVVTIGVKEATQFFERLIRRGQESGQIPAGIDPRSTAKALFALLIGIRVMGRGVFGKTSLQQIAGQADALIS